MGQWASCFHARWEMKGLWLDVGYGWRTLRKNSGFAALAVLTLALGIGANTTIFSWINSTLLNPIPGARDTSRIVSLTMGGTVYVPGQFSYPDYLDLRAGSYSFSGLAAFAFRTLDLTGTGKPERLWAADVSANYFNVFGVRPILGRGFVPAEDQKLSGAPVAVLSYSLWQRRFGGDDHILGRTIFLNQHRFTIVGVAPAAFQGTMTGLRTDLWVPLMMQQQVASGSDWIHDRGDHELMMQGRLARHQPAGATGDELAHASPRGAVPNITLRRQGHRNISLVARSQWGQRLLL